MVLILTTRFFPCMDVDKSIINLETGTNAQMVCKAELSQREPIDIKPNKV